MKPRQDRIKKLLRERGIDGAIASSPENFHYITGIAGHQHTVSRQAGFSEAVLTSDDKTRTHAITMDCELPTFQKKLGAGFFGGEGFVMQQLSGSGTAFVEIDGYAVEYELAPGQQIVVDTGNLTMMDATCSVDIQAVKGVKNMLFGGEGIFHTVVTGPGKVTLQTMPVSSVAATLAPFFPNRGN